MRPFLAGVMAAACAMAVGPAAAQSAFENVTGVVEVAPGGGQEFGTAGDVISTAFAHDFHVAEGVEGPMQGTSAGRICQSAACSWLTGLHLPSGVRIRRIELSACDNSATQQISLYLLIGPRAPGAFVNVAGVATGYAAVPGCNVFGFDLPTGIQVVNDVATYALDVVANGTTVYWNQARVFYRLQVSPAPATASFTDVPTSHPAFRYVEALAASGITGGCGNGNYCPDAPLTRSQMAIFLATALGLHFPN